MKIFVTEIKAVCVDGGVIRTYAGPKIPAMNMEEAKEFCRIHLPFCNVYGQLSLEVPLSANYLEPIWDKAIDYEKTELN